MSRTLVAWFSAGGVTGKLAERLADSIGADCFEIVPEQKYTAKDLDRTDKNSRSTIEMNDRSSRPAISSVIGDVSQYDVIFVGFPIWWYREPSIIDTFMESYGFSGKKIVPFATSGGSDMGQSGKNMAALAAGAIVDEGKRFSQDASESDLKSRASKWL